MDTTKWKSVAIRTDIVKLADKISKKTERPKSYVFAYAIKRLAEDIEKGVVQ
jgi:predicted DNA-binding protein|tara:strand:- start:55 stop:210 length:156 start_codon:yes stop_codon:yes gene_type:complete